MIKQYTRLNVADNTGAKQVMCIGMVGANSKKGATIGDVIFGAVKDALPNGTVKKKEKVKAIIVRVKKPYQRPDGTVIRFDDNAIVIITAEGVPVGTRIFGPVAKEIRDKGNAKIVSMAPEII